MAEMAEYLVPMGLDAGLVSEICALHSLPHSFHPSPETCLVEFIDRLHRYWKETRALREAHLVLSDDLTFFAELDTRYKRLTKELGHAVSILCQRVPHE